MFDMIYLASHPDDFFRIQKDNVDKYHQLHMNS